jgi:hypothetical protein
MCAISQIANRHFGRKAVAALARKGVAIVATTVIPGEGDMPFAAGETGYVVSDNGCGRVWTHRQVVEAAQ